MAAELLTLLLLTGGVYLVHRPAAHHHPSLPWTGMVGGYRDTRTRGLHTSFCAAGAATEARVTWGHLEHPLRAKAQCTPPGARSAAYRNIYRGFGVDRGVREASPGCFGGMAR